jgi:hypothetical protein
LYEKSSWSTYQKLKNCRTSSSIVLGEMLVTCTVFDDMTAVGTKQSRLASRVRWILVGKRWDWCDQKSSYFLSYRKENVERDDICPCLNKRTHHTTTSSHVHPVRPSTSSRGRRGCGRAPQVT